MKLKGSIILEAAYTFPIILISIFIIILLAYYRHDNLVLKSGMRRYLMRSLVEEKDYDFDEERISLYYMEYKNQKMEKMNEKGRIKVVKSFDVYPKLLEFNKENKNNEMEEIYRIYRPQKRVRNLSVFIE